MLSKSTIKRLISGSFANLDMKNMTNDERTDAVATTITRVLDSRVFAALINDESDKRIKDYMHKHGL